MSSPNPPETHQPDPESKPKPVPQNPDSSDPQSNTAAQNPAQNESLLEKEKEEGEGEGEEEEGECGFCLFMKGGGCKDTFVEWEKCVEEGEKHSEDIVEKCFQTTAALKKCMEAHSDYYAPLLQAEKAAEEEAAKQLEEEKALSSDQVEKKDQAEEKVESLDGLKS